MCPCLGAVCASVRGSGPGALDREGPSALSPESLLSLEVPVPPQMRLRKQCLLTLVELLEWALF